MSAQEPQASSQQLEARLRKNLGIRAPNIIRVQLLGRDCFSGQNFVPAKACDSVASRVLDFDNFQGDATRDIRHRLVRCNDCLRDCSLDELLPSTPPAMATASSSETAAIGLASTSASALIAANPTRRPVKEPGPEATANASICCLSKLCFVRSAAICGTSCAEKVPPASATTSSASQAPSGSHRASAMLPCFPEVSAASRSMDSMVPKTVEDGSGSTQK